MKITFLGAARTVSGSCFMLEHENVRFAVDCGMHQGNKEIEKRNENLGPYDAKKIDFILVTHAHIDHTGLLPAMVSKGYSKPIYCTAPTKDLLEIMLLDSAHIQEMEAEWENRRLLRKGKAPISPLYSTKNAEDTIPLLSPVEYSQAFEPAPGIKVIYKDAGHILGSAFIEIEYQEDGKDVSMVFSGDLGQPEQLIVKNPTDLGCANYLFLESTYGNRVHEGAENNLDELAEAIAYSYGNKEKVVIPAFAVERSQQLIYSLFLLRKQGRLPADMPVYLDSPLAIRATEVFRKHPEFFDKKTRDLIDKGENPLDLPNLKFTLTRDQSQAINETRGPAIIIAASGMANAGRIKHHLRHNLWRPGASVVFVGWQGVGTPGRRIVEGAKSIKLFSEDVDVKAKIFTINGFSGHGDRDDLMHWLDTMSCRPEKIILIHGEAEAQKALAEMITEKFSIEVHIPEYMEALTLEPGAVMEPVVDMAAARPRVDWEFLLSDADHLFAELRKRLAEVEKKSWVDQTDIRDRVLDVNRSIVQLITEL